MILLYADPELGDYGYVEKLWYQPGERLAALVEALAAREIVLPRASAPPASDAELALFHSREHIAFVTARCATDQGSLDRAPALVNARSRMLLQAIADAPGPRVDAEALGPTLRALDATLAAFAPFLASEGLVTCDAEADVVELTSDGQAFLDDPDGTLGGPTYARAHVERAARSVCGAVLDAVGRLARGEVQVAFVPIAGFHHAHRDQPRLYCLYNDPGLAIEAALQAVDGTVAYLDTDIHHGDGVHAAFADHPRVVLADLHEAPRHHELAADTARTSPVADDGTGRRSAIELGPLSTNDTWLSALETLLRELDQAAPAFLIWEAGVDGLVDDPLSNQALTPPVFREAAVRVKALADAHTGGRLLVLGGGGYELEGLAAGWVATVEGLRGD